MVNKRRRAERFSAEVLLWWTLDWESLPVNLLDISDGGMSCEFPQSVAPGQQVELQFEFPKHGERIDSVCEVVYVQEKGSHRFQVGLKIIEIQGIDKEQFSEKMQNLPLPDSE